MNIIAIDIGNTHLHIGLFIQDAQVSIESLPGQDQAKIKAALSAAWDQCPVVASSAEGKRDAVIVVSSVQPERTEAFRQLVRDTLNERIYLVGADVDLPISAWVDAPEKVGTDRLISAAAAVCSGGAGRGDRRLRHSRDHRHGGRQWRVPGRRDLSRFRYGRTEPQGPHSQAAQG